MFVCVDVRNEFECRPLRELKRSTQQALSLLELLPSVCGRLLLVQLSLCVNTHYSSENSVCVLMDYGKTCTTTA